ncbi:rod shape-determining protein RodA [Catenovulum sp. 2E275]|uniref:rod shape-determining protein RodA n=1 Tax=Catenovulum sp. 2E275 TaxID=2980497 RepID=UPI0021CF530A|nr:rod shape-determining protein RodA [Catenovulum sp. 2E275]MCU4675440.1 rod shape-determining protein RodA [Catenovulum sp. 2E275]
MSAEVGRKPNIWQKIHIDRPLLAGLLTLSIVGLFIIYSASGQDWDLIIRQLTRLGISLGVMFAIAQVPPSFYQRWAVPFFIIGCALLVGVLVFGVIGKGARRWIDIGVTRIQPSEIMKLAVPIMIAWFIARKPLPPKIGYSLFGLALIIIPTLLIAKQPDLGTSLLIATSGLFVIFLSGLSWRLISGFVVAMPAVGAALWFFYMHDYQKNRVLTFLNPESDPLGAGYHIIQSKIAIGSGGLWGKGWLQGTQSQLEFLPERHTDFIFAVFSEEFGLFGILALLSIYLYIVLRGMVISVRAQDAFSRLLAGSITLTFFVYVFVNMGMVSGILPVVGVPLPLVSYGGTSMITLMAGFGILMAISTQRKVFTS